MANIKKYKISKARAGIYEDNEEDICCSECSELLDENTAYTCQKCSTEFCKEHILNHKC